MATFTAYQSTNMATGLALLDSDVMLEQLQYISDDGMTQDWAVAGGKNMFMHLFADVAYTSPYYDAFNFSAGFDTLRLHVGATNYWDLTGNILSVTGSASMDLEYTGDFYMTINVAGMGTASIY